MNRYTSTILLLCLPLLACEPADPYDPGLDETPGSSTDAGDPGPTEGWCCDCIEFASPPPWQCADLPEPLCAAEMWCDNDIEDCKAACGL